MCYIIYPSLIKRSNIVEEIHDCTEGETDKDREKKVEIDGENREINNTDPHLQQIIILRAMIPHQKEMNDSKQRNSLVQVPLGSYELTT